MHYRQLYFWYKEEVAVMSEPADELHNKEDAATFGKGILFFLALIAVLFVLGVIFWAAV